MTAIERLVFFGSPAFAVPTLEALLASGYRPALVVTQPTRPAGRGRRPQDPPVAVWARDAGLELMQPPKVGAASFRQTMRDLEPDVAVVVAFGQIFGPKLLRIPRLGCVNLHASLLPRFRGAAPIQAAMAAGDAETGVTTMLMDEGMDTGPILLTETVPIGPSQSAPELSETLARVGGRLVVETLRGLATGEIVPRPQPAEGVVAPRLVKSDGFVRWAESAARIERRYRAYQPWPGLQSECRGRALKLVAVQVLKEAPAATQAAPGTFLGLREEMLAVACGDGSVLGLGEIQRPGKRALAARDFLHGEALRVGDVEFCELANVELRDLDAERG